MLAVGPWSFIVRRRVKPNRAQEILYGPTLEEYLCGEQIGLALCDAIKHHSSLMLTDIPEVLALRPMVEFPLLMVVTEKNKQQKLPSQVIQSTQGENMVCVQTAYEKDLLAVEAILQGMAAVLDLEEPFGRIHEAISEAQGGIRKQKVA